MNTKLRLVQVSQWILAFLFSIILHGMVYSQETNGDAIKMVSDFQLIENLASNDIQVANAAIEEILERSERMIPLLIQKKGDQRFVLGQLTRSENSATLVFLPSSNSNRNKKLLKTGKLVTVEVAALYLITAIYYNDLYISQSPYLTDFSTAKEKRTSGNTDQVVEKAWESIEVWYQKFKKGGLENLRKEKDYPLKSGEVRFW